MATVISQTKRAMPAAREKPYARDVEFLSRGRKIPRKHNSMHIRPAGIRVDASSQYKQNVAKMGETAGGFGEPQWLLWSRKLQSIAQSGLAFTQDPYDRERYETLRALAAEIVATHSGASTGAVETLFASERGYATPKLDVRGAVFDDRGRLLLVRETADEGRWTLPGGWADVNESPSECVVKEVREESGYDVRVRKLAAVWDRARHAHTPHYVFHIWKLFFICEVVGGRAAGSLESSEPSFFGRDELPTDLSVGRVLTWQLARMFEHAFDPDLRTDYD